MDNINKNPDNLDVVLEDSPNIKIVNNTIKNFLINLKRRPDRLENFNKKTPFKYYNLQYAFDGKNMINEIDYELTKKFKNLNYGEIGCFMSHIRIYQTMVKENIDYAFIMEDDIIFEPCFENNFDHVLENISKCEILYVGGRFGPNFKTDPKYYTSITSNIIEYKFENNTGLDSHFRINIDRTTHGYIISKKYAEFLLNIFNDSTNIILPIDHWLIITLHDNNLKINSCNPLICYSTNNDSDIR